MTGNVKLMSTDILKRSALQTLTVSMLGCCCLLLQETTLHAQDVAVDPADPVLKVEVDWRITLLDPDPLQGLPQIKLFISPNKELYQDRANIWINASRWSGVWEAGGIYYNYQSSPELDGAGVLSSQGITFATPGEVMLITHELRIDETTNQLWLVGNKRTSVTFGDAAGNNGSGVNEAIAKGYTDLYNFNLQDTIDESEVFAGKNRVDKLEIVDVRYTRRSGAVERPAGYTFPYLVARGLSGSVTTGTSVDARGQITGTPTEEVPLTPQ